MKRITVLILFLFLLGNLLIAGCEKLPAEASGVKVTATTTIVGDVVKQIGGERISLTTLLPTGADPHTYEPRPKDVAAIHDAQVIFINGLELEHSMEAVIEANAGGPVVVVSDGIEVLPFSAAGDEHGSGDPHTWMDPKNVQQWVENIVDALLSVDPEGASVYQANAEAYLQQLADLDAWIKDEVAKIPAEQRKLVTDHQSLGYFAEAYGLEQVGLVISSLSTNASVSAQDLARLEEVVRTEKVKAIFIEMGASDALASQVARDAGIAVVRIYTGSLGSAESGAGDYINFMRFNVNAIVSGLR
jgi:ABC-type Zn uptake system ZnuABC Zn-binding protein ZnuA